MFFTMLGIAVVSGEVRCKEPLFLAELTYEEQEKNNESVANYCKIAAFLLCLQHLIISWDYEGI